MIINLPQGIADGEIDTDTTIEIDTDTATLTVWDEYYREHVHIDLKALLEYIAGHDQLKGLMPNKKGNK